MADLDESPLAKAYNRALKLEKQGDIDGAAAAYRQVLVLDPDDRGGAAMRLAAIGRGDVPQRAPAAYIETLFDQHAAAFETILVEALGYAVPMTSRELLQRHAPGPYHRMLDLGCGTGLAGVALSDMAGHLTGVDLAEGMLGEADEKQVYDDLFVGDATSFLEADEPGMWDLIVATDVLPYIGAVDRLFAATSRKLTSGGVFAFSSETLDDNAFDQSGFTIGSKPRYAHADHHIRQELAATKLRLVASEPIVVRHEDGAPVRGYLYLAAHRA